MTVKSRGSFAARLAVVWVALGFAAACSSQTSGVVPDAGGSSTPDAGAAGTPVGCQAAPCNLISSKPRELFAALPAELEELVEGNTAFAVSLFKILRAESPDENLFFSPHSISSALAMTYAGARGPTADQMAAALAFGLPQEQLHRAFNALDQELARRGQKPTVGEGEPPRLTVANAMWGAHGFKILPSYLDLLAVNYGAGLRLLDFAGDPDAARATINGWVEENTNGRIKNLVRPPLPDPMTRLVLTNAIYFKASWLSSFEPDDTMDRPFNKLDGQTVSAPTLQQDVFLPYVDTAALQAVTLPFVGDDLSMVIIAPKAGTFAAFESAMTAAALQDIVDQQKRTQVLLRLPKFNFGARSQLRPALQQLGMLAAFEDHANFTGISAEPVLVSDVVHQAFVAIDEKGAEAAAATAVFVPPASVGDAEITVNVDRPFLFLIRDRPTGSVLFVGRVLDPTQR